MKRYLCLAAILFVPLVILVFGQQSKRVPKNLSGAETVYYVPGETVYHEKTCPEIAGKHTWGASLNCLMWRKFTPCQKCLYKDVPIGPTKVDFVPSTSGTSASGSVAEWVGKAQKNTETFTINTNEWVIAWITQGDSNFIIELYNADTNELVELVANIVGNGGETSVMRGKGRYYLKVNTSQPYSIVVTEKR